MKRVPATLLALSLTVATTTACVLLTSRLQYRGLLNLVWMAGIPIGCALLLFRGAKERAWAALILLMLALVTVGAAGYLLVGDAHHTSSTNRP